MRYNHITIMKKLHHIPAFDSLYWYENVKKKVDLNRLDTGHAYLYVITVKKKEKEKYSLKKDTLEVSKTIINQNFLF